MVNLKNGVVFTKQDAHYILTALEEYHNRLQRYRKIRKEQETQREKEVQILMYQIARL